MKPYRIYKTILLFVFSSFFTLAPNKAEAQFLNKDATWTVCYTIAGGDLKRFYHEFRILKDSLINDTLYSIFTDYYKQNFALREEGKKVFYRALPPNREGNWDFEEHLLYDFSLKMNDSLILSLPRNEVFDNVYWRVIEIDSVLIGDKLNKRITLKARGFYHGEGTEYWIENVGSNSGPIYPKGISEHEFSVMLECFRLKNEKLYGFCEYLGVEKGEESPKEAIYYNNMLRQLMVKSPSKQYCRLNIYTLAGERIFGERVICNAYFSIKTLQQGLYVFELKFLSKETPVRRKIFIN